MLKENEIIDNNEKEEKEKEKETEQKEQNEKKDQKEDDEKEYSKKIGDYILFEQIGQGTFSKVTRAYHIITEQIVAVKILDKEKIEDEIDIERIIREIEILRSISHPNISQMYETYSTVHNFYLMMEYVDGGDLFDYISDNNFLSEQKSCYFFRQLIGVMEYLSELGISHRDIKPENILLDKDHENIKVIDFGLSNYCMEHELLHSSCGSPCYASPEMLSGNPYKGITTDLWSAGIVLYSMLVGALPFDDQELHKLYEQIKTGKFYIPSTLSLEAIDLLKRILQVDPKKRITIQELKEHRWFNIETNPMYKGVNIFYEHLPCDTKVVQYVIKKYFSEDQDITFYSFIKMVHMHACNKYTATYYLTKKYILKIEDNYAIRKSKKSKNKEKKESQIDNKENNQQDIATSNKEKGSSNKSESKTTIKENNNNRVEMDEKLEDLSDTKNEFDYDNDLNSPKKDEVKEVKINLRSKSIEKEKEKEKEKENNNENKEMNEINDYNFITKKSNNTRNIKNQLFDNNSQTNNNSNINFTSKIENNCFFLTTEEGQAKQMNKSENINIFLSKDKFEVKQGNNSKIENKGAYKTSTKDNNYETMKRKNQKENIQKKNNFTSQQNYKKNKNSNNKQKEKVNEDQNKKYKEKKYKKTENKANNDEKNQLKIGLSLINIKNIGDKYKMHNESNTDRNASEKYKNTNIINRIYSANGNYTINTIYKKESNRNDKKMNTYVDNIISPKKSDLNFYIINNIINKDKQEKKKNTKNELFNLEIKSNINKKNFITTNNKNENITVNINNNNYIDGNLNQNQCQNISLDNQIFNNKNNSKDKNVSSQIKVNLKSSKGDIRISNSPAKNSDNEKDQNKEDSKNARKQLEIEIFSNKIKNLNKYNKRKTPSPMSLVHIQDKSYEGSNIMKFNNNYFNNILGQSSNDKCHAIINLSSSQNRSDNNNTNSTNINKKNINNNNYKKKTYKERIKKMIINHKKGKSLYTNCLESKNIFNYLKGNNKKKRKNNHQRNVSSVLKYQLSDFRNENKGLNFNSINSNTVVNNECSTSRNKNVKNNTKEISTNKSKGIDRNNTNNILSYSKEKIISPKIIYQFKNNLQKKRLFLQNSHNNNMNSIVMKNKLMITTTNSNNSRNANKSNHYFGVLNQSNSTNNHFLTDNTYKLNKINSNDNNLLINNKKENNYISNLSLVLKSGINKNKKSNNNDLMISKGSEKNYNKKQKK